MNKALTILIVSFALHFHGFCQQIEPPFWWADMPVNRLQLMINHPNIASGNVEINYPGVRISKTLRGDSPNYLFVYLETDENMKLGKMNITITVQKKRVVVPYEIKIRDNDLTKNQGFNSTDVIYLLMPDRFANGDPSNDSQPGMLEKANKSNPNARHGGDIKGIVNNLDYIKSIGMTAIWLTPVFENDMTPEYGGYHGYAATDLYKVDRRLGSNEEFRSFVQASHSKGMKVIMDMIHNHIGDQHPWMKDLPTKDWVHDYQKYGQTSYRGIIQSDPYASQYDLDKLERGWFVKEMPDLNQRNEQLADYLIQNTIWWIEYSGVDGIRMDTYVYPYKDYMARWAKEVLDAYPSFNIVGEAWIETVPHTAYWQGSRTYNSDGYNSYLPSVTDFQFTAAISGALNSEFSWTDGLRKLYYYLSQDRLYEDPLKNVIFLDNHDLERFFTQVGEQPDKFKMAYAYLMTTRGIPQVYYGTELMFANVPTPHDSRKRPDMPGGWSGDERSVFTKQGRTDRENEAFDYVQKLTTWRKTATAIHEGKTVHFLPEDNIYVYFRYTDKQRVMVVLNGNNESKTLDLKRFNEMLKGFDEGKEIISDTPVDIKKPLILRPLSANIYELK